MGLGGQCWHMALAGVRVRDTALSCSLPQEFYGDYIAVNPHVFSLNLLGCCRVGAQRVVLSVSLINWDHGGLPEGPREGNGPGQGEEHRGAGVQPVVTADPVLSCET